MARLHICRSMLHRMIDSSLGHRVERVFLGLGVKLDEDHRVLEVYECPNISKTPEVAFTADPECLYMVLLEAERRGMELTMLGHSHPAPPSPSMRDVENMKVWRRVWLIISSTTGDYAAWIHVDGEVRSVEVVVGNC